MTSATTARPERKPVTRPRATAPAPAPRELDDLLAAPGHPIDPGLRHELEARLGHDFGRVRIHTDPDAETLTDLVGADAVTVGQDIFFAEGKFRPGTWDGRRLLVHELMHTIQLPHPSGALSAGRQAGAVSRPADVVEREAEQAADRPGREGRRVERHGQQAASWFRYATVAADRLRGERLDPATLVDRLVAGLLRSLRGDPVDASGRVRLQLGRMAPRLRSSVLERLETRLPSSEYERVLGLVERAETTAGVGEPAPAGTPGPVDEAEEVPRTEGPEQGAEEDGAEEGGAADKGEDAEQDEGEGARGEERLGEEKRGEGKRGEGKRGEGKPGEEKPAEEKPGEEKPQEPGAEPTGDQEAGAGGSVLPVAVAGGAAPAVPGMPAGGDVQVAGAAPVSPVAIGAGGAEPVRDEQVDAIAEEPDSPLVRHGLLRRPQAAEEQPRPEEEPVGVEPGADTEVEVPPAPELPPEDTPEERAEDQQAKPEDFVPATDPDLSGVPTADDELTLPTSGAPPRPKDAPSFPAPPPVAADALTAQPEPPAAVPEQPAERTAPPEPERTEPEQAAEPEPETAAATTQPAGPESAPESDAAGPAPDEPAAAGPGPGLPSAEPDAPGAGAAEPGTTGAPSSAPGVDPAGPGAAEPAPDTPGTAEPGPAGALPQDASMEPGGGSCGGAPAPAPEPEGGGGGCGGTAGAAAPEQPRPAPPDVSAQPPQAALSAVGALPPDQMQTALTGVDSSVSRDVGEQRGALRSAPPTEDRPSGAPRTLHGAPESQPPSEAAVAQLEPAGAPAGAQQQRRENRQAAGVNPANRVGSPNIGGDAQGNLTEHDVANMQNAVNSVPTSDPALNTTVGPAPNLELSGESDPERTEEQSGRLRESSAQLRTIGRDDAGRSLGENQIYPDVPAETLTARAPAGAPAGGAAPGAEGGAPADLATSVVAQQERGPQLQAAVGQGQGQMADGRQTHEQGVTEEQQRHRAEVAQAVAESTEQQAGERGRVAEEAAAQRVQWRAEQDQALGDADTRAGEERTGARQGIEEKRTETDRRTEERRDQDNGRIDEERRRAEEQARRERERKREESSGWFGRLTSAVKQAFDALIGLITTIFDAARRVVNGIIDGFRTFVNGLIDAARDFVVGLIREFFDALIAVFDVLLAAFPSIRDKFRRKLEDLRDEAIDAVNRYADRLKDGINALLDKLAEGLNGLLNLLERAYKAAVRFVRDAVNRALEWARAAIQALGQLAELIAGIAADPVGWIRNLGNAAMTGVRSHLWSAIKAAVRRWFNEKVESVLGLGRLLWNVLIRGCMSVAKIGAMVWQAVVAALPMMIITLIIEKLVSLIIPAAGAVLAIAQGVMAAWGTISRVIAAFGKFFAFLKAVRGGNAACLFAEALAAGVVALLEFITNFLLARLAGAVRGVAGRLKGIGQRVLAALRRGARSTRRAAGAAVNTARRALRAGAQTLRRGAGAAARGARRGAGAVRRGAAAARGVRPGTATALRTARRAVTAVGRGVTGAARRLGRRLANTRVGRALRRGLDRVRAGYRRARDRIRDWNRRRQERARRRAEERNSPQAKEQRLRLIVARIRPRLSHLLRKGVRRVVLRTALAAMRIWYRLTALTLVGSPARAVNARLNPNKNTNETQEIPEPDAEETAKLEILRTLREEGERQESIPEPRVQRAGESRPVEPESFSYGNPLRIPSPRHMSTVDIPAGVPAMAAAAGFTQLLARERLWRARLLRFGGPQGIAVASFKAYTEKMGILRLVQPDPRTGIYRPIPGIGLSYPDFRAQNERQLLQAIQAAEVGDYEQLRAMTTRGGGTAVQGAIVTQYAEPGRSPYARTTSRSLTRLGEAAAAGRPGGIPLGTSLGDAPFTLVRSLGSEQVLRWRERRQAGLPVSRREPFLQPMGDRPRVETPDALANRIIAQLRATVVIAGLVTEQGGREASLRELCELVRRMLADPNLRRWLYR